MCVFMQLPVQNEAEIFQKINYVSYGYFYVS